MDRYELDMLIENDSVFTATIKKAKKGEFVFHKEAQAEIDRLTAMLNEWVFAERDETEAQLNERKQKTIKMLEGN